MKKIITLLLAAGAFVTVNAQTSKDEARKVILGQPKNGEATTGGSTTSKQGRDVILGGGGTSTNRYPGYPTTTTTTKKKGDCGSKTKNKSNNGKHLGWEKGKGNPHRTGAVTRKYNHKRDDDHDGNSQN
jgi:hypothetical protein